MSCKTINLYFFLSPFRGSKRMWKELSHLIFLVPQSFGYHRLHWWGGFFQPLHRRLSAGSLDSRVPGNVQGYQVLRQGTCPISCRSCLDLVLVSERQCVFFFAVFFSVELINWKLTLLKQLPGSYYRLITTGLVSVSLSALWRHACWIWMVHIWKKNVSTVTIFMT